MKQRLIFHTLLAALTVSAAGIITSCDDAEADVIDNRVYITEATSAQATKIAVEEEGAKVAFTVRMAEPATQDVKVKVKVDPSILPAYNELNKTNFEALPEEFYKFDTDEVVIKAGEVSGPQTLVTIYSFTTGGKNYALPVAVDQVEGPVTKTSSSSKFIYILDKPLIVKTPIMTGGGKGIVAGPFDAEGNAPNWGVLTQNWTLEGWVRMSLLTTNNQAIFNTGSADHEIYIRFGDVNRYYDYYPDIMNYLQIKTLGSQVETGPIFTRNKWHHFALTYDGTNCTIYVNGVQEAQFAPPAPKGGSVRFDYLQMVSSGSYFRANCNMSQVRLWRVALTQTQIQNNMFYELDASNPDMFGYWKMDEGQGTAFKDSTPNRHDTEAKGNNVKGWTEYLRFDK